jgi:Zn-dependent protease with chaperone function
MHLQSRGDASRSVSNASLGAPPTIGKSAPARQSAIFALSLLLWVLPACCILAAIWFVLRTTDPDFTVLSKFIGLMTWHAWATIVLLLLCATALVFGLTRSADVVDGVPCNRVDHARLFQLSDEIARRLRVAPIGRIIIAPGCELCILSNRPDAQTLVLGMAALCGLSVDELQIALAHEYGHHVQRGRLARRLINQTIASQRDLLEQLSRSRVARLNPIYRLLQLCNRGLAGVARACGSEREFDADRLAVQMFGQRAFCAGLVAAALQARFVWQHLPRCIALLEGGSSPAGNIYQAMALQRITVERSRQQAMLEPLLQMLQHRAPDGTDPSLLDRLLKQGAKLDELALPIPPRIPSDRMLELRLDRVLRERIHDGPLSAAEYFFPDQLLGLQQDLSCRLVDSLKHRTRLQRYARRAGMIPESSVTSLRG